MSDEKPKRKATSGTRHGNGASIWGGAKGPGRNKPRANFGATTNAQGHSKATPAPLNYAEVRRQREDAVEAHLFHLALNAAEQRDQIAAGKTFMVERTQIEGAEGGPLQILYSWADEPSENA